MRCPHCNAEIESGARFCAGCGARLDASCPACGAPVRPDQNYCGSCGAPLPQARLARAVPPRQNVERTLVSRAAREGERKQVTVLFADVKASLELVAGSDPEEARAILDPVLELMMEAVHHHEGTVNQVMGDGIMALFGAPVAHEDHALRACLAALRMQNLVQRQAEELRRGRALPPRLRIGLNSGPVVVRSVGNDLRMDYTAVGQTTHIAARMEQLADPGAIFMSADTYSLARGFVEVAPLGPVQVKGLTQPVDAYRLLAARADRPRFAVLLDRGLTRFVGRDEQLGLIEQRFADAAAGRGNVLAIAGEPGIGKSRLLWEFARAQHRPVSTVLVGECESHAVTTAYFPIGGLLRQFFGLQGTESAAVRHDRLASRLDALRLPQAAFVAPLLWLLAAEPGDDEWRALDPLQRRRRVLGCVGDLLRSASTDAPLVLAIEDLQWIDSESQAVLELLVDRIHESRIMLLVTHRPGFEHRWAGRSCFGELRLEQLSAGAAFELLDALVGDDPSVRVLKRELIERTGGNPFFLEESVRALAETGVLRGAAGHYHALGGSGIADIPATVYAVLAARIDRLPEADKRLLQSAAVIGTRVSAALLEAIAELSGAELRQTVARLTDGGFLAARRPDGETEYGFRHALTCEVAYQSLVLQRRRSLHAAVVETIEARHPAAAGTGQTEELAHHARLAEAWPQALRYSAEAGRRALARSANRAAVAHFEHALEAIGHLEHSGEVASTAIDLRFDLRNAYGPLGEHEKMFAALKQAELLAGRIGDQRRLGLAMAFQSNLAALRGEFDTAVDRGLKAAGIAEALDDVALRVVANAILAITHWSRGEYRKAIARARWNLAALEGALKFERLGMAQLPSVYSRTALVVALAERGEFAESFEHAARALSIAEASGHPQSLISACFGLGSARLQRGDCAPAIELLERGIAVAESTELGGAYLELVLPLAAAHGVCGHAQQAIDLVQTAVARAIAMRNRLGHWIRAGGLGEALLRAGRPAEALPMARLYVNLTRGVGARGNEAWALRLLGEVLAKHGDAAASEAGATLSAALALARELEMRPLEGRCLLALGELQGAQHEHDAARASLEAASGVFHDLDMPHWNARAETELQRMRDLAGQS